MDSQSSQGNNVSSTSANDAESTSPARTEIAGEENERREGHSLKYHPKYFDSLVIFKVEDVLFKVPKLFLIRDSSLFDTMFSCPHGSEEPEGMAEERPIVLPDVEVKEFETLMDFYYEWMYPTSMTLSMLTRPKQQDPSKGQNQPPDEATLKKEALVTEKLFTLLSISTRYLFDRVRDLAIFGLESPGRLSSYPLLSRIQLARKFGVENWLKRGYTELCAREEALGNRDVEALGMETVLQMAEAREMYVFEQGQRHKSWLGVTRSASWPLAEKAVTTVFFPQIEGPQEEEANPEATPSQ